MRAVLPILCLLALASKASAKPAKAPAEGTNPAVAAACPRPLADVRKGLAADGLHMIEMTEAEYHFAQGLWAMDPRVPGALPVGDHAFLVSAGGGDGDVILFALGERACTPYPAPKGFRKLLPDVDGGHAPDDGPRTPT